MPPIRIGRFDDFKGAEHAVLIEADRVGLQSLIDFITLAQRTPGGVHLRLQPGVEMPQSLDFRFENVPIDRGLVAETDSSLCWQRSSAGWDCVLAKIKALAEATSPSHQYLDGPSDDASVIVSIGEYGEQWWKNVANR